MNRRTFLASSVTAVAAAGLGVPAAAQSAPQPATGGKFRLKYAPHFGMFRHHAGDDPLDQIHFIADVGFTALEDNGMMDRPVAEQEKIGRELARRDMTMGVFVAYVEWNQPTMVHADAAFREHLAKRMRAAVEVAKRVNARWCTVVPGPCDPRLDWGYQTANVIENLKIAAGICEPAGLVMVLEPLNPRDHPNLFLTKISQAYQICRAVGSPTCKILDDLYHQQVTEGNLIPNIEAAWSEIAYFQLGDNPGRKEPTTGEINYRNIFRHLYARGYEGVLGMEHGNALPGKEGERAVIDAYRWCDEFVFGHPSAGTS